MALVTTKEMFQKAYRGGYAIGAFNFNNMETIQAITEACREEAAPVILQVSQDVLENHTYMVKLAQAAAVDAEFAHFKAAAVVQVQSHRNVRAFDGSGLG